jgi:ABC-2 type transport system ATP-binding protein
VSDGPANAVEVRRLVKRFGDYTAVDHLDLDIRRGELLALLGPNGAGKSTTLRILTTLLAPDEGSVTIGGYALPAEAVRARPLLGLVPQEIAVYDALSPRRNLAFFAGLYGQRGEELARRVQELIERVNLTEKADQPVYTLSGGMQRRVNIAAALVHEPQIVFLDEPTVGLDPELREDIWDIIRGLRQRGTTLVLTTHYMEEAEALCDRVAIMDRGKVVGQGTPAELIEQTGVQSTLNVSVRGDVAAAAKAARGVTDVSECEALDGRLRLTAKSGSQLLPDVIRALLSAGCEVTSAEVQAPNLGAVYRHFTGRELENS